MFGNGGPEVLAHTIYADNAAGQLRSRRAG